jgi:FtsP/CotA-like multicopper oxidase with cupredoxin domain
MSTAAKPRSLRCIDHRSEESGIEPKADAEYVIQLQEWLQRGGSRIRDADGGAFPNYFTINGKAYPSTDTLHLKVARRSSYVSSGSNNNFIHPMHVHGGTVHRRGARRSDAPGASAFDATRSTSARTALRRNMDRARTGQVARPLPHRPPHDEQQHRNARRSGGLTMITTWRPNRVFSHASSSTDGGHAITAPPSAL